VSNAELNCATVTDAIVAEGNTGVGYVADCTKGEEVEGLLAFTKETYGNVDVVINAGIHSALPMGFAKMTEAAWETGIALNLTAHFNLIHKFLPHFHEVGAGNFIHMTTIASSVGLGIGPQRHAYAAGKAAAATLTQRIGVENAKKNIRGNVIGIGYVTGPLVNRAVAQAIEGGSSTTIEKVTAVRDAYVPRGYQVVPEEVANLAAFLSSDLSSGVNGTEIYCDAGTSGCTYGP
jgi:3-hydroxybutyrate dehydrogenase